MTKFFFRHGGEVAEAELANVRVGARGESGDLVVREDCGRCGGNGWIWCFGHVEGGICFGCRGARTFVRTKRVYTEDKLEKLNAAKEKRTFRKAEERRAREETAAKAFNAEIAEAGRSALVYRIKAATGNGFLADLAAKLEKGWMLSDKAFDTADRVITENDERAKTNAASEHVGEVKERIDFEAEVVGVFGTEGHWGHTDIIKLRDTGGNLFTWFASVHTGVERGARVAVRGTVKKHGEFKGTKETVLTRCVVTTIEEREAA
jgi:hypothetical protein